MNIDWMCLNFANLVCQTDFRNDLSSICTVADVDPMLELDQSVESKRIWIKIFLNNLYVL